MRYRYQVGDLVTVQGRDTGWITEVWRRRVTFYTVRLVGATKGQLYQAKDLKIHTRGGHHATQKVHLS